MPVLVACGLANAVPVGKGLRVEVGIPVAAPVGAEVAELVAVGEAEHDAVAMGVAVAVVVGDGVAVAAVVGVAVAVAVGAHVDVTALATPPNGPVNATTATETSNVANPVARPTSPTRCSFSQTLCRDPRKIVTIPW